MFSKQELGNYLKEIRNLKHISLRKVNEKTGISYTLLNMIENGKRNVTPVLLRKLANLYDISYLDLYEKAGYIDLIEDELMIDKSNDSVINIPIISTIKNPSDYLSKENWIGTINVDKKLSNEEDIFALKVHEDSMFPLLLEEDILVVKKQNDFETGDIVVATINENETIIRKGKKGDNSILLQPLNPDYEPLVFTKEEMKFTTVTIIGIVKQLQREF